LTACTGKDQKGIGVLALIEVSGLLLGEAIETVAACRSLSERMKEAIDGTRS
jgi:hypothetical protein